MEEQKLKLKEELSCLHEQIRSITVAQIRPLQAKVEEKELQLAHMLCPFVEGQTISDGKETHVVDEIAYRYSSYILRGRKIKKNGQPGAVVKHIYQVHSTSEKSWKVISNPNMEENK